MSVQIDEKLEHSLEDCFFFLQGSCNKGSEYEYRHSPSALLNQNNCRHWMAGTCRNLNCKFRHPSIPSQKKVACYYFQQGTCTKGVNCPFSHSFNSPILFNLPLPGPMIISDDLIERKKEELRKLEQMRKEEEDRLEELKKTQNQVAELKSAINLNTTIPTEMENNEKQNTPNKSTPPKKTASSLQPAKQTNSFDLSTPDGPLFEMVTTNKRWEQIFGKGKLKMPTIPSFLDTTNSSSPSNPVDFGVKPLDEILKQKPTEKTTSDISVESKNGKTASTVASTISTTSTISTNSTNSNENSTKNSNKKTF